MRNKALLGVLTALGFIALATGAGRDQASWTTNFPVFAERLGACFQELFPARVSEVPRGFRAGPPLVPSQWLLLSLDSAEAEGSATSSALDGLQGKRVSWVLMVDRIHFDPKEADVAITFSTSNLLKRLPPHVRLLSFTATASPSARSTAQRLHSGQEVVISGTINVGVSPGAQLLYGIGNHAGEIGVMIELQDADISKEVQR